MGMLKQELYLKSWEVTAKQWKLNKGEIPRFYFKSLNRRNAILQ
jgi:hypothetical protein